MEIDDNGNVEPMEDGGKSTNTKKRPKPPEVNPYLFPFLLAAFGLWCFYDGWITTNPEMLEHQFFNRVASGILLPWAVWDYLKLRKHKKRKMEASLAEDKKDRL